MTRDAKGKFLPGFDLDRHLFTQADCQKGYRVATREAKMPSRVRCWLRNKLRRQMKEPKKGRTVYPELAM